MYSPSPRGRGRGRPPCPRAACARAAMRLAEPGQLPEVSILNTSESCYGVLRVRVRLRPWRRHLEPRRRSGTHLFPIPNREVKPASAMYWAESPARGGRPQSSSSHRRRPSLPYISPAVSLERVVRAATPMVPPARRECESCRLYPSASKFQHCRVGHRCRSGSGSHGRTRRSPQSASY